jgi:hypothetical protein
VANNYIFIEEEKAVVKEDHYNKKCISEVIEIEKHSYNFNRDDELVLYDSRNPLIHVLRRNENH